MRKILLLMLFSFAFWIGEAQIKWHSIDEALLKNKTEQKYYLLEFYTEWCEWCDKMDSVTFKDTIIEKIITRYFQPIKYDAQSQGIQVINGKTYDCTNNLNQPLPNEFTKEILKRKISYPAFAFFDANFRLITVVYGYQTPIDLEIILWYFVSNQYRKIPYNQYHSEFYQKHRVEMLNVLYPK